jgi:hypothetical protein
MPLLTSTQMEARLAHKRKAPETKSLAAMVFEEHWSAFQKELKEMCHCSPNGNQGVMLCTCFFKDEDVRARFADHCIKRERRHMESTQPATTSRAEEPTDDELEEGEVPP